MLAQLADLEARIAQIGCGPQDVLDDVERSSKWLHDKAFRRIWHGRPIYRTEAMRRTPRNLLEARAREGNWAAFSVSPGPYFTRLQRIYEHLYVDWRGVGSVVLLLRIEGDRMLAAAAASRDDVLAVRRAIVGAPIDAMVHADDAGDELGQHFRDEEELYLGHLSNYLDRPGILRDLLELATWEDYGLFHHIEAFLKRLPERAADLAVRELAQVITELRAAGLDYQVSKAQRLRRLVLTSGAKAQRPRSPTRGLGDDHSARRVRSCPVPDRRRDHAPPRPDHRGQLASACPGSSTTYTWIVVREPRLLLDRAEHRSVRRESTPLLRQATCPLVVSVENGL
jgi:hypothetical protein